MESNNFWTQQSNFQQILDSDDEEELSPENMDENVWKRYRLVEWTEDVTIMWLRYVNNIFHKLDAKTEYLLTEMILYEGYDGKKLKQKGFMKSHPSRLPRISSLYILEALVSEFLL